MAISQVVRVFIVLVCIAVLLSGCETAAPPGIRQISLGEAIALSRSNNIAKVSVESENGWMIMTTKLDGEPFEINGVDTPQTGNKITVKDGLELFSYIGDMNTNDLRQMGFVFPQDLSVSRGNVASSSGFSFWYFLPLVLIGVLFLMLIGRGRTGTRQMGQMMDFGRSKARLKTGETPKVTFADVAGVPEAKQDLQEVVEFFKNREKFQRMGARIPKGVLLVGPPGTGKTLLAKAVAGEAGVSFFSISGSEFVEMFVGVGASRVRDLFAKAKESRPSVIFIDEIDAVGRKRSAGQAITHEEREQTLNQILAEMDGFNPNEGVIVMAATNRPDILDAALLRPGRFDRRVVLDAPDFAGRRAILDIHTKGKPLDRSVNLDVVARETHGFSGADLANLVNEAAILASRRDKNDIGMDEIEESIDRIIAGPSRKSRKVVMRDKERTAYHESGHALVARMLPNADPLFKISIIARGAIGGYTRTLPEEEQYLITKPQLQDNLAMLLAGHTAETIIFGNVSTGPHSDIKRATDLARKMVTEYGMSEKLSLRTFGGEETEFGLDRRDYGDEVAREIDQEVHLLINEAHNVTKKILTENKPRLVHLAKKLMEVETLEGEELEKVFTEPIPEEGASKEGAVKNNVQQQSVQPDDTVGGGAPELVVH